MINNDSFRLNFKHLLKSHGYTQNAFADASGIPSATVSRYCSGQRDPEIKQVAIIADFFSVSIDWLMGNTARIYNGTSKEQQRILDLYARADDTDIAVINTILDKYAK